ncbi:hypothetical protein CTI18_04825 [Prevotella intermedia]|uniref:Uncharacterized protein n=1 Tax=Prevotella intermedia TaxID=28131 RepID=A0A2G8IAY6_PREIN|nr:hypothetical protein CTI18_04825 [Prevotella intermedia]
MSITKTREVFSLPYVHYADNFDLTLRKRLFCDAKEPLLPCKTYAFTMQNNRFYNTLVTR